MAKRKQPLDKETEKIINHSDKLKGLINHEGWSIAKEKLHREVAKLMSVTDIMQESNPDTIIQIIAAKKRAADILLKWVADIEGTVFQTEGNKQTLENMVESFIINEEDLG